MSESLDDSSFRVLAASHPGAELASARVSLPPLPEDEVEIDVEYCGICHSDLSMWLDDWQQTSYPFVPGHEIVGIVRKLGAQVTHLKLGQRVGIGWFARSCQTCPCCLEGDHNLCSKTQQTIVGRYGGFAERVRSQALWAIPLPDELAAESAGPLFCGGITVFNPMLIHQLSPTAKVGVVGIGGLGHMALRFLNAWGCEVTAFSSSASKKDEALAHGAHHFVDSTDARELSRLSSSLDLILVTVNVPLDWEAYIAILKPKGVLHFVGAAPDIKSAIFPLIAGQKSISGSPLGSPANTARMLAFAARHQLSPAVEVIPMSQANQAFERLQHEKPAHRFVLKNDLAQL